MLLLHLSPVSQSSGIAAQAHTSAYQPSSLLFCVPNLENKRCKKGKLTHQLSFHRGGNRRAEEGEPL